MCCTLLTFKFEVLSRCEDSRSRIFLCVRHDISVTTNNATSKLSSARCIQFADFVAKVQNHTFGAGGRVVNEHSTHMPPMSRFTLCPLPPARPPANWPPPPSRRARVGHYRQSRLFPSLSPQLASVSI